MDQNLLEGYRTGAQSAASNVAQFQQDIPGLMSGLKTNLTSIFAKDNPMMAARENALTTYLNTPSQTRANLLPSNQRIVEGSPLNYSPTQQNAMVEAAQNAALVPLLGLNQSIVGQYGNIGEILQAAATTYQSMLDAAKTKATSASELYQLAIKQDQFDRQLALEQQKANQATAGNNAMAQLMKDWMASQNQESLSATGEGTTDPYVVETDNTGVNFRSQPFFGEGQMAGNIPVPSVPVNPAVSALGIPQPAQQTNPYSFLNNMGNISNLLGLNPSGLQDLSKNTGLRF